ncbi:NrtA/SsuA/CpmA family ABC transporter substrate-binding protein [Methylobacter sp.]|uniref:ABC transporter substrate-binding protein n=1 Tax=Methylobacter sp. TaxID=2051955 RepID=UPI0025DDA26A|nr:NrtA/SsuA/CpmA family ABC transporter substrate-binding protein [Methylobacter sp.]
MFFFDWKRRALFTQQKRFVWKALMALMFIATLAGCQKSSSDNKEQRSAEPLQKITVAYTYQPQSTLVHIAVSKGYFAEEGFDIQPLMHTYGKAALQSVIENKADFATVAETPVMFNVLKGEKIFVIANIEASSMNNAIVARKDAGIASPGDLKGKRIGFTPGTTSDFFLDSLLTANGLIRQEIEPVPLKPEEMQDAVMAKKVDAVSTWNYPLTQISRMLGADGTVFYDKEIYTETFNIASRQDFVRNNPDAVKRFLRALIKAEDFVTKNPDEAQSIMSLATKIDKDLIHEVWNDFNYRVVLDQTLLITLEDETRWAMKNKLTDQTVMPDYLSFIDIDSLKAVKPEAIRMNR